MFESFIKMSPADKMLKAKTLLSKRHPFYANIMYNMKFIKVEDPVEMPTMGVNEYGWLYWGVDFVRKINDVEGLMAVLVHEILHIVFLTFLREKDKHHKLWNISTDICNNYVLTKSKLKLPDDIVADDGHVMKFLEPDSGGNIKLTINNINIELNVDNMTAEEVYDYILDKIKDTDDWNSGEGDGCGESNVHSDKDDLDQHMEGGIGTDGNPDGSDKNNNGDKISKDFNEKRWKNAIAKAAQAAKAAGNNAHGYLQQFLDELLNPKLNWKVLLYNYIVKEIPYDYTMARPSKRSYTTGVYIPSTLRENLELVITVDISGSISSDEYKEFISEILGICNVSDNIKARLLFWDTSVDEENVHIITRHNRDQIKNIFPNGGGGTDIGAVRRYCEANDIKSQLFVHLTDGCVWGVNDETLPHGKNLCIITSNGNESPLCDYAITVKLKDS